LDAPIVPGLQQAMVVVPPTEPSGVAVWALQLGHSTAVCPQRSWIVHLWAEGKSVSEDGQQRVRAVLESLADCGQLTESSTHAAADGATTVEASILEGNERACPTALLAAFFTLQTVRILPQQGSSPWPANVVLCPGPSGAVELSDSVAAAKECYWQLYPQQQHQTEDQSSGGHLPPAFPLDPQSVRDRGDEDSDEEAVMALQAALGAGIADGADRNEAAD